VSAGFFVLSSSSPGTLGWIIPIMRYEPIAESTIAR
jgi:hypothetical protein